MVKKFFLFNIPKSLLRGSETAVLKQIYSLPKMSTNTTLLFCLISLLKIHFLLWAGLNDDADIGILATLMADCPTVPISAGQSR